MHHVCPDLVVAVPGLIGSVLSKDGKPIWGFSAGSLWRVIAGNALEQLELKARTMNAIISVTASRRQELLDNIQNLPGLWKQRGYSILVEQLVSGLRLTQNENYREFAYDWRRRGPWARCRPRDSILQHQQSIAPFTDGHLKTAIRALIVGNYDLVTKWQIISEYAIKTFKQHRARIVVKNDYLQTWVT